MRIEFSRLLNPHYCWRSHHASWMTLGKHIASEPPDDDNDDRTEIDEQDGLQRLIVTDQPEDGIDNRDGHSQPARRTIHSVPPSRATPIARRHEENPNEENPSLRIARTKSCRAGTDDLMGTSVLKL